MIKERLTLREKESTIKVLNTEIAAVRKKDIVKKGVRVYENDKIGVSGSVGDVSFDTLEERAIKNLQTNISYPYDLEKNFKKKVWISDNRVTHEAVLDEANEVLTFLKAEFDDFDFQETITVKDIAIEFENTEGIQLGYADSYFNIEMILKDKALANLFDGAIAYNGRNYDREKFITFNRDYLGAYRNKVDLPEGETLPVIVMSGDSVFSKMVMELNGERYGNGSSLLANKLNESVFNEKITIEQDLDPVRNYVPFFDGEGVVNDNYTHTLVKNGVLKACYTNKKIAAKYNLEHTGAASAEYDGVPTLSGTNLTVKRDSEDIKSAVGNKAIFVLMAAGGDFTDDGAFAAPVQVSFLFDGEKIIGKLPEFQMKSHFFKMFNEDYLGTFESPFYFGDDENVSVFNMTIVRG